MRKFTIKTWLKENSKHTITFLIILLLYPYFYINDLFDFQNVPAFFRIFLAALCSWCLNFLIEWIQGVFFNANKGKKGEKFLEKDWVRDTLTATISGFLGSIIFELILNYMILIL